MTSKRSFSFGFLAACWALATGRWGSYLPREPLFFADLFVVLGISQLVNTKIRNIRNNSLIRSKPVISANIFFAVILIRFLGSDWTNPLITLRDFAPYFYFLLFFIGASDSRVIRNDLYEKWIKRAIIFHAIWSCIASWNSALVFKLPLVSSVQNLHLFGVRPDFDSAVIAVLMGYILIYFENMKYKFLSLLFLIIMGATVLNNGSRSGFLSLVFVILFAYFVRLMSLQKSISMGYTNLSMVVIILGSLFLGFSNSSFADRLFGTFAVNSQTSSSSYNASGTTQARLDAWNEVIDYSLSDTSRTLFGVSFGRNYLLESGALKELIGLEDSERTATRAPHNYFLNTMSRLGLVGLVPITFIVLLFFRRLWTLRTKLHHDPVLTLMFLIPVSLIGPANLGVVLESPFGAIPFFYCLGYVIAKRD